MTGDEEGKREERRDSVEVKGEEGINSGRHSSTSLHFTTATAIG